MNVKVYYSAYRNADGAALFYMDEERRGEFVRRGRTLRRAKNAHENRSAVSYGLPVSAGFCRFTFWESFKKLSRERGSLSEGGQGASHLDAGV